MEKDAPVTKHERLENWLSDFASASGLGIGIDQIALCLRGYVDCFNQGQYYEAHDVLEHAWLQLSRTAAEWAFLKGMIQLAGGFVHLRLQYLEPSHRVHGRRLGPAGKLFALAEHNLSGGADLAGQLGLDINQLMGLIQAYSPTLRAARKLPSAALRNPWEPERKPVMLLTAIQPS